ncbi:coniferyl aldehyde dehydrogenase [Phyllobacterium sp. YR531]|uniref:coniferyl aldehyde dehydrogenase n=1 Tax=Phyllobacterium sp. YR531 TaxID=1144343 RepID=UPI00059418C8|nr:coniferyl aldehyde dehydrogenase [Phyllobacterium sp. YR531]
MTVTLPVSGSDMATVLDCQRASFLNEEPSNIADRKFQLKRLRAAVLTYRRELAEAVSADFGHRSHHETDILEVLCVVQAIDYLNRNLRRFMRKDRRHVGLFYRAGRAYVEYQPKGVIGVMSPWNYPFSLTIIPLATALAAGNRVMLKPSELTPCTSDVIQRMITGTFPPEEVAVVLGGPEVGATFSGLPFDHILFTGSTPVGRKIMKAASDNLVPLTLELGGKSPTIVAKGHATRQTLDSIVFGKLSNGGQTCIAPDYALVHEEDLKTFITEFEASVARFYPDGPTSRDYTSIINDHHYERLKGLVEDVRTSGARIIETGLMPDDAPQQLRTLPPTLVVEVGDDAEIMREEIFGPILPVRTYRSIKEVIDYVNARPRPLALYYFGAQDADCGELLARTTSGNVGINNTLMHFAQDDLPFGGVGPSGMGAYHGIEGFRSMSHAKGIFIQGKWNLTSLLRAPFGNIANLALKVMLRSHDPH